jgi:hypothetical protein
MRLSKEQAMAILQVQVDTIDLVVEDWDGSGENVTFHLRRPTVQEENNFNQARYPMDRKLGVKDRSNQARVDFFDLLFQGVDNLELSAPDQPGGTLPITRERVEVIPRKVKAQLIFKEFEELPGTIDIKK